MARKVKSKEKGKEKRKNHFLVFAPFFSWLFSGELKCPLSLLLFLLLLLLLFLFVAHVSSSCPSLAQKRHPHGYSLLTLLYLYCCTAASFLLKPSTCLFISVSKRFCHHQASVYGEVLGIYVSAGDRNVWWSLLIGWFALRTYLDSGLMAMCFWQSNFGGCFSFLCSFVVLISRWQVI